VSTSRVSSTYARAVLREALGPWVEDLRAAARSLRASTGDSARDPARIAQTLPLTLRPEVRRLVQLLAREGDLDRLPDIVQELDALISEGGETNVAQVTSAVELTPEERQALETKLRQRFGQDLLFDYEVDPSLLGGVRVRVGDMVIDGTVAARLGALRERIVG